MAGEMLWNIILRVLAGVLAEYIVYAILDRD